MMNSALKKCMYFNYRTILFSPGQRTSEPGSLAKPKKAI